MSNRAKLAWTVVVLVAVSLVAAVVWYGFFRRHELSPPREPQGLQLFVDVTEEVGLHFVHDAGPTGGYYLPQLMGSGAALLDYDNDGRLDLFLIQNGGPDSRSTNRLFHQKQNGTFEDVSAGSGLDVAGWGMGAAVGDVDNDGFQDLLMTMYGQTRLFRNNGNGTFSDVTQASGIDNPLWGTSACFFDYDRDGWLDLVIANYLDYDASRLCTDGLGRPEFCAPKVFVGAVAHLYRNLGKQAGAQGRRFENVTLKAGLGALPGKGLGVVCADFNGDGWPDILVANDGQPNRLWINRTNGTFSEEAVSRGLAYDALGQAQANMGIALGDLEGRGLFDVFITHLTEETNTLWQQGPRGSFQDRTTAGGLAAAAWRGTGFGTVLADFDQDGSLDLAVVNGAIHRGKRLPGARADPFWLDYAERNQLFVNDGSGRFRDISESNPAFCGTATVGRGLAVGDITGSGAQDLLVTTVGGAARLYRNEVPDRGHWLIVRAIDPALRRDAYGAEVTVRAGPRRWKRWLNPGYSYLCSNDPRVHVGLGTAASIDAIDILWPDGAAESFPGGDANRRLVLRKGEGKPVKK